MTAIRQPSFYWPTPPASREVPNDLKPIRQALLPADSSELENGSDKKITLPPDVGRQAGQNAIEIYLRSLLPAPHNMRTANPSIRQAPLIPPAGDKDGIKIPRLLFPDVPSSLTSGKLVLNEALRKNRMGLFTQYLHHLDNEAVNKTDSVGATALDLATLFGNQEAVQALLAKGAKVDTQNNVGAHDGTLSITTVDLAVHCGEVDILANHLLPSLENMEVSKKEELLEKARTVRQELQTQLQPLQTAAQKHDEFKRLYEAFETADNPDALLGQMAMLLKQGVMIDSIKWGTQGKNIFHGAASTDKLETMKALILLGADIDKGVAKGDQNGYISCEEGTRSLHLACYDPPKAEAVKLLLKAGADAGAVNRDGENALHFMMQHTHSWHEKEMLDVMDLLLETGVALDKRDSHECTALLHACLTQKWKAAKKLIDAGATVESAPGGNHHYYKNRSALHWAASSKDGLDVFKLILEKTKKENLDKPDSEGATPLGLAIESNNIDAIRLLIENGADINKVSSDGETVLHTAALAGDKTTIDFLLNISELRAKINQPNKEGKTALQCAFVHNDAQDRILHYYSNNKTTNQVTFSALLKAGADIDAPYEGGKTMLYHALKEGTKDEIALLLDHHADLKKLAEESGNALHLAAQNPAAAQCVDTLLSKLSKEALNQPDNAGNPPLYVAILKQNRECVHALRKLGADESLKNHAEQNFGDLMLAWLDDVQRTSSDWD